MSYHCDWCGELIDSSTAGRATLKIEGVFEGGGIENLINDSRRHFHAGRADEDDTCLLKAVALIDTRAPSLESIPTATPQSISRLRAKHHRHDDEAGA